MKIIDESEKIDYVEKEMSFIHEKDMPGYQHTYSRRYRRKQKKIFWTEKYFGTNLHLGYAVKRVAIVILLIFGLTATSKEMYSIIKNASIATDGEYSKKRKTTVYGFIAFYYEKEKNNSCWIQWDDNIYHHMIVTTNQKYSKKMLKRIAESLYKK